MGTGIAFFARLRAMPVQQAHEYERSVVNAVTQECDGIPGFTDLHVSYFYEELTLCVPA